MEERTIETRGKWRPKVRKQSWGLPGRGDMEQGPSFSEVELGMVTRMMCRRKLREEGKKYSTRDGRAALPLQFV